MSDMKHINSEFLTMRDNADIDEAYCVEACFNVSSWVDVFARTHGDCNTWTTLNWIMNAKMLIDSIENDPDICPTCMLMLFEEYEYALNIKVEA